MSTGTVAATVADYVAGEHRMVIGGDRVPAASGATLPVENPATGERIAAIPAGDAADVDRAVRAARATFAARVWRGTPAKRRGEILWALSDLVVAHADELCRIEVLDNGMPEAMARALLAGVVDGFRYYAGACARLHGRTADVGEDLEFHAYSVSEPVGVAGLIVPWNGPLASLSNKLAPALAAGCSVVVKPAEQTSLSTLRLAGLVAEAGVPPGVVNVVTGDGPSAGAALVEHDDVDKISFTGSTAVGQEIVRASAGNLKRVTLELGGKSPVFVFDDADLDAAIPAVGSGIFANSGQVCFAGSRVYAQPGILPGLLSGLREYAEGLVVGDGLDPATRIGPLISQRQRERVLGYIESGLAEGADVVTGGGAHGSAGWFVTPTIVTGADAGMRIVREEIFGPVLTVMPFGGLDDVPAIGNATTYGLGAGVYTRDLATAHRAVRLLDAGNVWVNCYGRRDRSLPFGGFKRSGWGRENGPEGLDAFLEHKSVYLHL